MKNYYQTVTCQKNGSDEWVYYEGFEKEKAIEKKRYEDIHNCDARSYTEIREYDIPEGREVESVILEGCYTVL